MEMEKFYVAPEVEVLENGKVLCSSGSGSSGGSDRERIRWKR